MIVTASPRKLPRPVLLDWHAMAEPRVVLIAAPELIPGAAGADWAAADDAILTFADSEPLLALQAIVAERPTVIALERLFAASPRGAALIARIKSDHVAGRLPRSASSPTTATTRGSPRAAPAAGCPRRPAPASARRRSTTARAARRASGCARDVAMMLENRPAFVVDLSELGTQVRGARRRSSRSSTSTRCSTRAASSWNWRGPSWCGREWSRGRHARLARRHRVRGARPPVDRALLRGEQGA